MMTKKKGLLAFILLVFISIIGFWLGILPITIDTREDFPSGEKYLKGDIINPLSKIDVSEGCEIYLKMSFDDMYSDESFLKGKLYKCDDVTVLEKLKKNFNFTVTKSDLGTANSRIFVYQNGKLMFSSSIVLEKEIFGLQSNNFGWVKKNELIPYFRKFKRIYTPFVVFK